MALSTLRLQLNLVINRSNAFFQEPTEYMVLKDEMELEMDELNQHECMASMTTLIKHMQRNRITPEVEEASISQKVGISSLIVPRRGSYGWIPSFINFLGYTLMRPVWLELGSFCFGKPV